VKKPTQPGKNMTGTGTAPLQSKKTEQEAVKGTPPGRRSVDGFEALHESTHAPYATAPIGTMPPPTTVTGAAKSAVDLVKSRNTLVFLDRIAERMAFERTGTRLYELVLLKFDLRGSWPGGPIRSELERIHGEELRHFNLLVDALTSLGGDPTAMTPSADVTSVESLGIQSVVSDARTTTAQALHAMQIAELADHDGWTILIEIATELGHQDLASKFREAAARETEHLALLRRWNRTNAITEATGEQPTAG